jgi:hypothetical protein
MELHAFLRSFHDRFAPRSYVEIGVRQGHGLACSRTRTIGVDPDYRVRVELACDLKLVKATSDEFFARPDALDWFPEKVIDLTFIDGMHLFEFALRDFMNAERLSAPTSVVVLDDVMPRSVDEAARDRITVDWTGDVFKVVQVLQRYRPELVLVPVDTEPTGVVVVAGLDPSSSVLTDRYDEIVAEYVASDPQHVPDAVIHRREAADPDKLLAAAGWDRLVSARGTAAPADALAELVALRGTASYIHVPPVARPFVAKPPKPIRRGSRTNREPD